MTHNHDGSLAVDNVDVHVGRKKILQQVSLDASTGNRVGLCGPNGSGKSTLLRAIFGAVTPAVGRVWVGGEDTARLSRREIAHRIGVVLQDRPQDFDFTVHDVVTMGRTSHHRLFDGRGEHHEQIVDDAVDQVGLTHLQHRSFNTLSGGEKQRALLARCIAQETNLVMLDEPTNHLDIRYQLDTLELVTSLRTTAIMALHDLNLAAAYCDHIYLINQGEIAAHGATEDVLTPQAIREVFGVHADVRANPTTGNPEFSFSRLRKPHSAIRPAMETA